MPTRRRKSPQYVREMTRAQLHGTAMKFQRQRQNDGLSASQEWLWDAIISELEWRHLHQLDGQERCFCELCWVPYWADMEEELPFDDLPDPF